METQWLETDAALNASWKMDIHAMALYAERFAETVITWAGISVTTETMCRETGAVMRVRLKKGGAAGAVVLLGGTCVTKCAETGSLFTLEKMICAMIVILIMEMVAVPNAL